LFWELNCKVKEEYFFIIAIVMFVYRVKAEKRPNLLKVKYKMLISSIKNRLKELVHLLQQLSNAEYAKPYISLVALPLENIRGML
jgi:hypothetical protein